MSEPSITLNEAKTLRDYTELGTLRERTRQLASFLVAYGRHMPYCRKVAEVYVPYNGTAEDMKRAEREAEKRAEQAVCNCGLAEALLVGAGAEQACGVSDPAANDAERNPYRSGR